MDLRPEPAHEVALPPHPWPAALLDAGQRARDAGQDGARGLPGVGGAVRSHIPRLRWVDAHCGRHWCGAL